MHVLVRINCACAPADARKASSGSGGDLVVRHLMCAVHDVCVCARAQSLIQARNASRVAGFDGTCASMCVYVCVCVCVCVCVRRCDGAQHSRPSGRK
jgi:hypothetical protein